MGVEWEEGGETTVILLLDTPTPENPLEAADKIVEALAENETFCDSMQRHLSQWWLEFQPLEDEGHSQLVLIGFGKV
jgi:hypothetical protein